MPVTSFHSLKEGAHLAPLLVTRAQPGWVGPSTLLEPTVVP